MPSTAQPFGSKFSAFPYKCQNIALPLRRIVRIRLRGNRASLHGKHRVYQLVNDLELWSGTVPKISMQEWGTRAYYVHHKALQQAVVITLTPWIRL
jgi:hypothetical protein